MGEISAGDASKHAEGTNGAEAAKPYRTVLKESTGTLTDCLLPSPALLEYLQQKAVLSGAMVDKVLCRPTRPDKVRVLLNFLMNLGPESVDRLVEGLRFTQQDFLANILAAQTYT